MTVVKNIEIAETETEQLQGAAVPARPAGSAPLKRFLVFGTAAGLEVGETTLRAVIVRARPGGVTVVDSATIANFQSRSAQDWGREFHEFLRKRQQRHLSTTVLLPRRDVIVRLAALPGVQKKDIPAALAFQIDSMHPYGDESVAFGWARANAGQVLVGIVRQSVLDSYVAMFREAGIPVEGFTFSASAIHSALRLYFNPPSDFAVAHAGQEGTLEIYGESTAKPVFSAEFDFAPDRALALARSELRISDSAGVKSLERVLPTPVNVATVEPLAYATALGSLAKWNAPYANLLPAEQRTVHSRARWIPTIILAILLAGVGIAWLVYTQVRDKRYLAQLEAQISQVQPLAFRASTLDRRTQEHRKRIELLDDYRKRTQADIEIMTELSRIIPPTVWTSSIEIMGDSVTLVGEADQAAPLLKILDSSLYFRNSEFTMGGLVRGQTGEGFRIRTYRKVRK